MERTSELGAILNETFQWNKARIHFFCQNVDGIICHKNSEFRQVGRYYFK